MRFSRIARTVPVSVGYVVLQLVLGIATGTLAGRQSVHTMQELAAGVTTSFAGAEWWTVFTGVFIPRDLTEFIVGLVISMPLLLIAERRMGSPRALMSIVVTGALAVLIGLSVQSLGIAVGNWWATGTRGELTLDPVIGVIGAFMAATAFMSRAWRVRARTLTLIALSVTVMFWGDTVDIYRLIAALLGLALGRMFTLGRPASRVNRADRGLRPTPLLRRRRLIALFTAATALGSLLSVIRPHGLAPLALLAGVFTGQSVTASDVLTACQDGFTDTCMTHLANSGHTGTAVTIVTLVPSILMLIAAWGMSRGRRFGAALAIVVSASLTVVGILTALAWAGIFVTETALNDGVAVAHQHQLTVLLSIDIAVPLTLFATVVWQWRAFTVTTSSRFSRRIAATVASSFGVLFISAMTVLWVIDTTLDGDVAFGRLFVETLRAFIPLHVLGPTYHARLLSQPLGLTVLHVLSSTAWVIVIIGSAWLVGRRPLHTEPTRESARVLDVLRGGSSTLAYWTTWPGNEYWFSDDGRHVVAYRVRADVALALTEPLGPVHGRRAAIAAFTRFCESRHWEPAFYAVTQSSLIDFDALGWSHLEVAQETVIDLDTFDITSKQWQKVRHALNCAEREGVRAVWTSWGDLSSGEKEQVSAISAEWSGEKKLGPMGFTLGGFEQLAGEDVALMCAVDAQGCIHAITSWLPVYQNGSVVARTLDVMRRSNESMSGAMDFLIGATAVRLRSDGIHEMSLSGVPLAQNPDASDGSDGGTMSTVLAFLARRLEPVYGFTSLFFYKRKFNPTYRPLYLAFPDSARLPRIGLAVGRAYLPSASWRDTLTLVRLLFASTTTRKSDR